MNNNYLTINEITELEARGQSIAKADFFKDNKKFAKSLGFELTGSKQSNIQLAWEAIRANMENLEAKDSFRFYHENILRNFQNRNIDSAITLAYISHAKLADGYNLLASATWNALSNFIFDLGLKGLNTDNLLMTFINSNGNYKEYLDQFSRKNCNPAALQATEKLKSTLDGLFKDKSFAERQKIASVVTQYATTENLEFDNLHSLLNK